MAKTKLVREDMYLVMAAEFQTMLTAILSESLKECGITDRRRRRKICKQFGFAAGDFLDQCWFMAGKKQVYPLVCFSEKFLNIGDDVGQLGVVYAPSSLNSFYERAGCADWYFDKLKEDPTKIKAGAVELEDDPSSDSDDLEAFVDDPSFRQWKFKNGARITCWVSGEEANKPIYIWCSGAPSPIECRVRKGKKATVMDWTRMRKKQIDEEPQFRASVTLGRGKYAIDFRIDQEVFSAVEIKLK